MGTKNLYNIIAALLCICSTAGAQEFNTFYFMPNLPQAAYTNPALHNAERKVVVGLAGLNGFTGSINSAMSYNDLLANGGLSSMEDGGAIDGHFSIPLLFVGLNFGKNHFYVAASEKSPFSFNGNGAGFSLFGSDGKNIPGEIMSANLDLSAFQYSEMAVSYARDLMDDRLTVGVTAKALFGQSAFVSDGLNFGLSTSMNGEELRVNGGGALHVAGPYVTKGKTLQTLDLQGPETFDIVNYLTNTSNAGFAFDLGVNFKVTDQIRVAASVIDVGSIKWKEETSGFSMNGEFVWRGADISGAFDDSNNGGGLDNLGDSLLNSLSLDEGNPEFTTKLPTKLFIGGTYDLNEMLSFGILNRTTFSENGDPYNNLLVSVNSRFNNVLSLTGSYGIAKDSYDNIGVGMAVRAGVVQFVLGTSNIISLLSLDQARYTSVKFGVNFMFGKISKKEVIEEEIDESL